MTESSIGPGTVLAGRFRLEDLLQETAGARYWRATDRILARSVAVHVVPLTDDRAQDLLTAARASATITDGHFLRVLDAAQEDDVAYVVNEWGTGISLDTILADGPLPPRRAAWLVKEVAEAISTAHRGGVAHGRLRPEGVMVTEAGAVKVSGFVIDSALARGPRGASASSGLDTGNLRSDVLGLAALLYVTLVARWPGPSPSAIPGAPRENGRPLRPRQVRAGVPRPLDGICDRVLNAEAQHDVDPATTAQDICAALSDFIGSPAGLVPGVDTTTVIDQGRPADDAATQHSGPPAGSDPAPPRATPAGRGGPPWSAATTPDAPGQTDPEATRAGAPLFFDDDTRVGWTGPEESTPATPGRGPAGGRGVPRPRPSAASDRAEHHARGTARDAGRARGSGSGSPPPAWGPDADRDGPPAGPEPRATRNVGKRWLVLAAVIGAGLALALVAVFAANLGGGPGEPRPRAQPSQPSPTSSSAAPTGPVTIAAISDFDPEGDPPEENPEDADLAIDGMLSTAWGTSTYFDSFELQKDGVGLLVDLGEPVEVSEATLTLDGGPTDLQLFAADKGSAAPTSIEGLDMVASVTDADTTVDLPFQQPVTTRYLVVWLTSLPPVEDGFKGQVAEIVVSS